MHGQALAGQPMLVLGLDDLGLNPAEPHVGVAAAAGHRVALGNGSPAAVNRAEGLLEPGHRRAQVGGQVSDVLDLLEHGPSNDRLNWTPSKYHGSSLSIWMVPFL